MLTSSYNFYLHNCIISNPPKLHLKIFCHMHFIRLSDFLSLHCLRHILNSKNKYFTINHALESPAGCAPSPLFTRPFRVPCHMYVRLCLRRLRLTTLLGSNTHLALGSHRNSLELRPADWHG